MLDPIIRPLQFQFARRPGTRSGGKVHLRYHAGPGLAACGRELYRRVHREGTITAIETTDPVTCKDCHRILRHLAGRLRVLLQDADRESTP